MNKRKIKALVAFILCIGLLATAGTITNRQEARMTAEIPEHDGDVLVDSLNVQQEDASSEEGTDDGSETETVTSDDVSELEQSDSYFQEMRATINLDRNQVISMLTDAAATAETSAAKENASQQKLELLENMQKEQDVENAIAAKGLPECLVLITESGVNVTVNKQDLTDTDVAKICDIVMRETDRPASEIIIQSKF